MRLRCTGYDLLIAAMMLGILVAQTPSIAEALEIRVRDDVTVKGGTVTLRDIAAFAPPTDSRVESLARLEVSSAPAPGNMVTLSRNFLNYKVGPAIAAAGQDIKLESPENLIVRRTATIIGAEQLENIFKDHVRARSAWNPETIVFEKVDVPESIALPEGKVRWEVLERGNERFVGHVALNVNFFVDDRQVRNLSLNGKVTVKQEVVKASRRIKPGQIISSEDVHLVLEQSSQMQKETLTAEEDAVGKRAVRSIQAGQSVTARMIENPPVIKKGARVLIVAANRMIRVSAGGKAVEDGYMGEEVRVVNLSSGKEVHATVKGPGIVEVVF
ncbi:MAG: flagella basal body P-ring formation protein FlgA [Desulfobacteraceae bacterium]|nr:MAG: flagella basal body P-ring formation protein FlgA [Desulfobacteraceae bacterium]